MSRAEGRDPYASLPHIDELVEVHGLTDRDPEFFIRQAEREAAGTGGIDPIAVLEREYASPLDRMHRPRRRKAGTS